MGSSIVYVLTDVIGRGIGLIGRGILRGVGSAWRDPRDRPSGADYGRRADSSADYDGSGYDDSDYDSSGYGRDRPGDRDSY